MNGNGSAGKKTWTELFYYVLMVMKLWGLLFITLFFSVDSAFGIDEITIWFVMLPMAGLTALLAWVYTKIGPGEIKPEDMEDYDMLFYLYT